MATCEVDTELTASQPSAQLESGAAIEWSDWLSRASSKILIYVLADLLAVLVANWVAKTAVHNWLHIPDQFFAPAYYDLFYLPFFAGALYLFGAYSMHDLRRPEKELELICKAATFSFLGLIAASLVFFKTGFSLYFLITWYLVCLPLLLLMRFTVRGIYAALWKRGLAQQRALLLGAPREGAEFQDILYLQRHRGYRIVGVLVPPGYSEQEGDLQQQVMVLGRLDQWEEVTRTNPVDLIVLCSASIPHELALEMLSRSRGRNIEVGVHSGLFGAGDLQYEPDNFSGFFRFRPRSLWSRRLQFITKQILDRAIGLAGSVVVVLMMPFIAALIKLEDGGPIFYRSAYVARDSESHYYLKFRSMCANADQVLAESEELRKQFHTKHKLETDPRVTRVGKFLRKYSLDEFPQFFSVLLGRLSFVGPRTIRKEEGPRYGELLPKLLSVKPGVTGFWQVMGRQTTSYPERVQMDMFYIDRWSIWLDLVIMAKTIWMIIKAEGAY